MKICVWCIFTSILFITSCSSMKQDNSSLTNEIKSEAPTESSEQTKLNLIDILNQDSSITALERTKLLALVDEGFTRNREFQIFANQKKSLLIREYTKPFPNEIKISKIQNDIKKTYSKKIDDLMILFDKMTEIIKKHPKSADRFFDRTIDDRYIGW